MSKMWEPGTESRYSAPPVAHYLYGARDASSPPAWEATDELPALDHYILNNPLPPEFAPRDVPRRPVIVPGNRSRYDLQDIVPIVVALLISTTFWAVVAVLAGMALS